MDGLKGAAGGAGGTGSAGISGVDPADAVRLFGAAYRMLGSASEAQRLVRDVLGSSVAEGAGTDPGAGVDAGADPGTGPGVAGGSYGRLVREVFGAVLRREEAARPRREGHHHHAGTWLPEPVLTAGGVLGPLDTAERRESVSMARLVLLERLTPQERAAYVLREVFGQGPADTAEVLDIPEARCRSLARRARQRIRVAEGPARGPESETQRWSTTEELLRAMREGDQAALEELLAEDVVAWTDGGLEPGVVRRPVLGVTKVGRFLAAAREQLPLAVLGQVAEVNGDAAVVAMVGTEVVGVLCVEFGPQGLVGIRAVTDPGRLAFLGRQWDESPGRSVG